MNFYLTDGKSNADADANPHSHTNSSSFRLHSHYRRSQSLLPNFWQHCEFACTLHGCGQIHAADHRDENLHRQRFRPTLRQQPVSTWSLL